MSHGQDLCGRAPPEAHEDGKVHELDEQDDEQDIHRRRMRMTKRSCKKK